MSVEPGFRALDLRRQQLDANRENSSRMAAAYAIYSSTGSGESLPPDPILFGTVFTEKPSISFGSTLESAAVTGRLPRTSGGVVRWLTDNNLYTGAWIYVVVDDPAFFFHGVLPEDTGSSSFSVQSPGISALAADAPTTMSYEMTHHFTFTGVAMKNIPTDVLGEL